MVKYTECRSRGNIMSMYSSVLTVDSIKVHTLNVNKEKP